MSVATVADDATTRTANLLNSMALAILAGMALFAGFSAVVIREDAPLRLGVSALVMALEVGVLGAIRRGHVRTGAVLQTYGLWAVLAAYFATFTGGDTPGLGAFFVLIVAAHLLLDRPARLGFIGVVLVSMLVLAIGEQQGLLPLRPLPALGPITALGISALLMGLLAAVMQLAVGLLNQSLAQQAESNRALAASRADLERQVAARTADLRAANAQLQQEIEERTQALAALRLSEEKHRLLLDSIRSPVLAVRDDMRILYCNDAFAEMVDSPMASLEGQDLLALFPTFRDTRSHVAYLKALETGEAQDAEGPFGSRLLHARVYPTPWGILAIAEDVTERRKVEEERLRFASQLRTAAETAERLSAILDPEALLQETVELLQDRFNLYHVHVYLYDPESENLVVRAGSGDAGRALVAQRHAIPLAAERSLVARAAAAQAVVRVDDVAYEPAFLPNVLLPDTRSEVAIPLVARGRLVGVLDVQDDEPARFTPLDVDTFVTLAGQIAVAIENARLFEAQGRIQTDLSEARRRLDNLLDQMPQVMLYETGGGREHILGNTQAMLGYPLEKFTTDRGFFPSLINPEDNEQVGKVLADWSAAGRTDVLNLEFRCRRADGREIWVHDFMVNVAPEGEPPYLAGVLVDVTGQRQFIEKLRTAAEVGESLNSLLGPEAVLGEAVQLMQDRFELYHVHLYLYDKLSDALVVSAGSGPIGAQLVAAGHRIPMNAPRSLVAQAATSEDVVNVDDVRGDARFLPNPLLPETRSELALPLLARHGLVGVLDVQDNRPGRFTEADRDTFRILAGQIAIALENARVFDELRRVAERLKEVDRLKSEFLANMSHELRTPLNSIIGYAELILMGINGELDVETQQDVQAIYDNGQQLLTLINDLLDLAKIEAGRMRLEIEDVLVGPLLEEVRTTNAGLLLKKPIELSIEVEPSLPAIRCDRLRLQQILNNLVSNAVKFTEQGHIWLRAYRDGDGVAIEVEDTGIGIQDEDLGTIFDKFRQLDGSFTRRARGTGLGLAITHHLVKLHQGRIDVRSAPSRGTTFVVQLPIQPLDIESVLLSLENGESR